MPLCADTATSREKLSFENAAGQVLAAALERPCGTPRAYALFAHCFTCSKDITAASRISRALAERGIAVLRFDFTGIGNSEGDFANTNFSSNVADLVAAADHLRAHESAPSLLVGHSLGGAAVLAAAARIDEVRAVATIGAPSDPAHVEHLFEADRESIEADGCALVTLGGKRFPITRQFVEDISAQRLATVLPRLGRALLVLHAPGDQVVDIDHARRIYEQARHPKSFVSLDDADHLLGRRRDSAYAGAMIAAWADRYLPAPSADTAPARPEVPAGEVLVCSTGTGFAQQVHSDSHTLTADEPQRFGGGNTGPSPYELLLAALGTCTSMTLGMYAEHKGLTLERVEVALRHTRIHAEDCAHCDTPSGRIDRIERTIRVQGDLSDAQRARLLEIADRCPVHKTLRSEIDILSTLA